MKVQANFTPGDHSRALSYQLPDSLLCSVVKQPCIVRMYAQRGVEIFVLLTQLHRALERATMRIAGADVQDSGHSHISSALYILFAIRVKLGTINMCV